MADTSSDDRTEVGNYFVANYPPFSFWTRDHVPAVHDVLGRERDGSTPLGLYVHVPFCRKRCKFCYFRVYTDKNAKEVERYLAAVTRELAAYRATAALGGRSPRFVYFGGGTPSFLSSQQLSALVDRLREHIDWDGAEEVTFECEPGTLRESKLRKIREIGVTRLSLGVENFDDRILEENGRAHRSPEILRAYGEARSIGFPQINIDLIAGMVGETDANWDACIEKAIELAPESVTIYQMELPFNTIYSKQVGANGSPVADWQTKREWVGRAFDRLLDAGYHVSSGYTLVRDESTSFVYRDSLWHGADMLGIGVASFSHVGGVHYQNLDRIEAYCEAVEAGELPIHRALPITDRQRMIRELVLQMKLGRVDARYFQEKFGASILEEYAGVLERHEKDGFLRVGDGEIELTRTGLLRVDGLLEPFFEPAHRSARYA